MVKCVNCQGVEVELKQKGGDIVIFHNENDIVKLKKKKILNQPIFYF